MRVCIIGAALATVLLVPSIANAETLMVDVRRPAYADEAYLLPSMAIERFTGTDGRAFSFAVERALADARDVDGGPVFGMFEAGRADGAISGRADIDIEETRYMEKRKFCPGSRDRKAKCDDAVKEEVEITCRKRVTTLRSDIRIVRVSDGRVVFNRNVPNRAEHRSCVGDNPLPESNDIVQGMLSSAAKSLTGDFIPFASREGIRLWESRKGLSKEDGEAFKRAIKATKVNGQDACRQFASMLERAPDQRSLSYNMAVCAESAGDYEAALQRYRTFGNDVEALASVQRVEGTLAGLAQKARRRGQQPE